MNEQGEQIKKNFLDQWIRLAFVLLYIIVFGLLWRFIAMLLLVVIILQSLHRVIAAENNSTLLTFSEGLGNFLLKVLQYVLYLSDEKPIDFDAFFGSRTQGSSQDESAQEVSVAAAASEGNEDEEAADNQKNTDEQSGATDQSPESAATEEGNQQSDASDDDVFADISFTDQTDEAPETDEDDDDASSKTD